MKTHRTKLAVALVMTMAVAAAAQPGKAGGKPGGRPELVEKVRERVRMMRMWKLTELLQLDETTAAKLFPLLKQWDDKMDPLQKELAGLRKQLKQSAQLDDKTIIVLIDKLVAGQQKMHLLHQQRIAELRKVLSPKQQARLIIVMGKVDRAIQRTVRQAIQGKGGGGKKVNLDVGDDDDDE